MIETLFAAVLRMSRAALFILPALLLVRWLLAPAPRIWRWVLWSVLLFRLLCPVTVTTPVSLLRPQLPAAEQEQTLPQPAPLSPSQPAAPPAAAQPTLPDTAVQPPSLPALLWATGTAAMLAAGAVSRLRLRRRLVGAVPLGEGVWLADGIDTSFAAGLLIPRVYLPSVTPEEDIPLILAHEHTHIRRADGLFRLLAWLALCLHWFNPAAWLAFFLSERDMEAACDEAALRRLGEARRADYAEALLRSAAPRPARLTTAFGESAVAGRVRHILKVPLRPRRLLSCVALLLVAACVLLLATDPVADEGRTKLLGAHYGVAETLFQQSPRPPYAAGEGPVWCITADHQLYLRERPGEGYQHLGALQPCELTAERLRHLLLKSGVPMGEREFAAITEARYSVAGDTLYFAVQTEKGETLIGSTRPDTAQPGNIAAGLLLRLERVESGFQKGAYYGGFFTRSLVAAAGEQAASFAGHAIETAEGDWMVVGFTAGTPDEAGQQPDLGYAVFRSYDGRGYLLHDVHLAPGAAQLGICQAAPASLRVAKDGLLGVDTTWDVILSTDPRLAAIRREVYDEEGRLIREETETIDRAPSMTLFPWKHSHGAAYRVRQFYLDAAGVPLAEQIPESPPTP